MRLGDDGSDNFIDRTGRGGFGFGGGGGNMLGCLLPLVASRFGMVGVLILLLGYCALSSLGGGGGLLGGGGEPTPSAPSGQSTLSAEDRRLLSNTLLLTERVWGDLFQRSGRTYQAPEMVAYSNTGQSGCGVAQAAMGPFYCPTDQRIYIDPQFFDELRRRFDAPGDFAQIYVIAHEVGHHIQNLDGTLDSAQQAQARASRTEGNQIQVAIELQADCYAGVWAANARDSQGSLLESGDIEEGMRAAEAIGDDTLQKQMQGRVVPESFTHGTAAQRQAALRRGLETGDPAACQF
ncbi:neutral zinc metallopeptidase [Sphingomonas sp.]|uniref:KPN_02809 family neutral zinc metallopeptidase n=1 Tax=Sphingomonas sp. TaxID=28214 RepID=UPI00181BBB80|nr:neutral zinc metallopeptidase [Sphingomonas sp.]MBA3511989.1 neutral zinc metallopeptidase [Sphingomonas sp.]